MVRSGIVWETSRAVGSRFESLKTEELEDLMRDRVVWGRERVDAFAWEGTLRRWCTRFWEDAMNWEDPGRLWSV